MLQGQLTKIDKLGMINKIKLLLELFMRLYKF